MASALPAIATAASVASSAKGLFSKNKGTPAQPSQQTQGYANLPGWAQQLYERNVAPGLVSYFESPKSGEFAEHEVAPLHQFQQNALNQGGQGIEDIIKNIGQYMNPYQSAITDEINRNFNIANSDLRGNIARGGSLGGQHSSALGTQLGMNEETRQRLMKQANYENYQQALGLRRQTLADMLNSGNVQQEQQQNQLNAKFANRTNQINQPINRLSNLTSFLQPLLGGSSATGAFAAQPPEPSQFARFNAFAQNLNNNYQNGNYNNLWNSGTPQKGQYGAPQPGFFNKLFQR